MTKFRHPGIEDIHAVEIAARQARAEEVARLVRAAAARLRAALARWLEPHGALKPRSHC